MAQARVPRSQDAAVVVQWGLGSTCRFAADDRRALRAVPHNGQAARDRGRRIRMREASASPATIPLGLFGRGSEELIPDQRPI
jgi:hypothetical protein